MVRSKLDKSRAQYSRVGDQSSNLDPHAARHVWLEVVRARLQLDDGAAVVVPQQVVAADAHLENALVESANRIGLLIPNAFQCFVALEVFLPIELLNGVQQLGRRRRAAAGVHGLARNRDAFTRNAPW